jgi:hypothetical protein
MLNGVDVYKNVRGYFVYHGRDGNVIPVDAMHVEVHSSVRAINDGFHERRQLVM